MGSTCDVTVVGGSPVRLFELARRRVEQLERRWSRFIPGSEVCALSRSAGMPVRVSSDTLLLVDHGIAAWRWTSGRFDPTVLHQLVANGYDRSFELMGAAVSHRCEASVRRRAPGCDGILVDRCASTVTMPAHVGFDPGGIGKGLAADLVVEALLDAGARGACVSMGGDVRVSGEAPDGGWPVGVANPFIEGDLVAVVLLSDHGLATSNRLLRTWTAGGTVHNHLVDPATGAAVSGLVSASVITGQAWWSEVLTKVAMVDRSATRTVIPLLKGQGLYIDAEADVEADPGFVRFDIRSVV